jgi:hypothetical protein
VDSDSEITNTCWHCDWNEICSLEWSYSSRFKTRQHIDWQTEPGCSYLYFWFMSSLFNSKHTDTANWYSTIHGAGNVRGWRLWFQSWIFSFGLILYKILINDAVFGANMSPHQIMKRVLTAKHPDVPSGIPGFVRDLIISCWSTEPQWRPSFRNSLHTFKRHYYLITNDVNSFAVRMYVERIDADVAWLCRDQTLRIELSSIWDADCSLDVRIVVTAANQGTKGGTRWLHHESWCYCRVLDGWLNWRENEDLDGESVMEMRKKGRRCVTHEGRPDGMDTSWKRSRSGTVLTSRDVPMLFVQSNSRERFHIDDGKC